MRAPDEMARLADDDDEDDRRRRDRRRAPLDSTARCRPRCATPTARRARGRVRHAALRLRRGRAPGAAAASTSSAFGADTVAYAGKAFLCVAMARLVAEEGLHLDVATGGELHVALHAGFPPERIVFHGNNKSDAELAAALDAGVGRIVADSFDELDRLERARGRALGARRRCSCGSRPASRRTRTSSSRPAPTTRSSASPSHDGVRARRRASGRRRARRLELGRPPLPHRLADLACSTSYARAVRDRRRPRARRSSEPPARRSTSSTSAAGSARRYLAADPALVDRRVRGGAATTRRRSASRDAGLGAAPRLMVEPGRSIAAPGGDHAVPRRHGQGDPRRGTYVAVDGGHERQPPARCSTAPATRRTCPAGSTRARPLACTVAGKHCEQGDLLVARRPPARRRRGRATCSRRPVTGAYGYSMASNYNKVPRPAVVFVRDGAARVVVRRETLDDLVRLDLTTSATAWETGLVMSSRDGCGSASSGAATSAAALVRLVARERRRDRSARGRAPRGRRGSPCATSASDRDVAAAGALLHRRRGAPSSPIPTSTSSSRSSAGSSRPARSSSRRSRRASRSSPPTRSCSPTHGRELFETAEGAGRRPALRGVGRRRHPAHPTAARVARRRPHPAGDRHRQRHDQLHPHPHDRGGRVVRRRARRGAARSATRSPTPPPTSRASTPRRRRRSSRRSRSAPASVAGDVYREGITEHHRPTTSRRRAEPRLRREAARGGRGDRRRGRGARAPGDGPGAPPARVGARVVQRGVHRGRRGRRAHALRPRRRRRAHRVARCSATSIDAAKNLRRRGARAPRSATLVGKPIRPIDERRVAVLPAASRSPTARACSPRSPSEFGAPRRVDQVDAAARASATTPASIFVTHRAREADLRGDASHALRDVDVVHRVGSVLRVDRASEE